MPHPATKLPPAVAGGLRLLGPLVAGQTDGSRLAREPGRRRGPGWVVRDLPREPGAEDRARLAGLASLKHPSLALPAAFGRDAGSGRAYLVRPYVLGADLPSAARGKGPVDILPWIAAAAAALAILHRFGLAHGRVKGANFIVPRAALFSRRAREPLVILSDPAAALPERAAAGAGDAPRADAFQSDLQALGALIHELLTGTHAARGAAAPVPPAERDPRVPVDLERIVLKLLGSETERGYRDAGSVCEDLERLASPVRRRPLVPDCFLGREEELGPAVGRLAREGAALIAIAGEAGAGKSAFLERLVLEAQILGHRTARVRCHAEGPASFVPIREVLADWLPRGPGGRAWRARLRRLAVKKGARHPGAPPAAHRGRFLKDAVQLFIEVAGSRSFLAVDDAHLADDWTGDFLAHLAREIAARGTEAPSLAVAYRCESPYRENLGPLLAALRTPESLATEIELGPLPVATAERWIERALPGRFAPGEAAETAARLGGNPCAVRESLRVDASSGGASRSAERDSLRANARYLAALDPVARRAIEVLALLGRPAEAGFLASALRLTVPAIRPFLETLIEGAAIAEEGQAYALRHASLRAWLAESIPARRRQALHGAIARALEQRQPPGEESAQHWLRSAAPRRGLGPALAAARRLAAGHEHRRALSLFHGVLRHLSGKGRERRAVTIETAEAHARAGEHQAAIRLLQGLVRSTPGAQDGIVRARLGVSCHRAGQIAPATVHLEKALRLLAASGKERLAEVLRVESELAEIASNKGDFAEAEKTCRRALARLGNQTDSAGPELRREKMVLLETLAHLKLKLFRYQEARELFEQSVRAARGLELFPEKSLLLNNLGTLHVQENRLRTAVECYRQAERLSSRIGDDQSLAAIYSNLGALHAKLGEPDAADEALRRARVHDARSDSRRVRLVRLHNAGLAGLILGRYSSAIEAFEEAVAAGEEIKDAFFAAFDLVYLGECRLYRGEWKAAQAALERALSTSPSVPAPIRSMVAARRALLAALDGDARAARREPAAGDCGVAYLDAWNRLYAGWAARLAGEREAAAQALAAARAFFRRAGVPAGETHAGLELAALDADAGDFDRAAKRLRELRSRFQPGRGALQSPMLSARLLAYETRVLLAGASPAAQEAAPLLVEAESFLIGRRLADIEDLCRDLRRRLRLLSLEQAAKVVLPAAVRAPAARDFADDLRHAARDLARRLRVEIGEERSGKAHALLAEFEERVRELGAQLERRDPAREASWSAASIVGKSAASRELGRLIRQAAPLVLPVLITGETGTGKELVARAVHGESARRSGPFVSVNCAALPEPLLEAELFGYVKGAFSGAEADQPGLLRSASGGSFLFDEVGELPLALQGKVLRALDRGCVRPVGGVEESAVDVRYVFSTHQDLPALLAAGRLRADFYYRLRVFTIPVPPLRERLEDLPFLVEHFRRLASGEAGGPTIGEAALRALAAYPWPGNVRELENAVTHLVLTRTGEVTAEHIAPLLGKTPVPSLFSPAFLRSRSLDELLAALEREYLLQLGADRGGDVKAVARECKITLRALYARFARLGIRPRDMKPR